MTRIVLILFWLAFATVLTRVQAQGDGSPTADESMTESVTHEWPQPVTVASGARYVCGGIGEEESEYMKQAASDYDLMLTFAARDGSYLADVGVEIKDAKGKRLLQTVCAGPMLLVEVPKSGRYRIHAEAGSYSLDKNVNVRAKGSDRLTTALMVWPLQVAEGPGARQSGGGVSDADEDR